MMKTVLKITAWISATIAFIVLIVILLLNTPAVQNYVIDKITSVVSSKTKSTITIGRIGIAFPKSIFLKNVFLDDRAKDTLLYAGEIKADLDMLALLKGDIIVNKVSLDEIKANINRQENDSLYNFSFILNAFENKDTINKASDKNDSAQFVIRAVELTRIHLLLNDKYAGIYAKTDFEKLEVETEKLDLPNLNFYIRKINFSDANVSLTILKNDTASKSKTGALPFIDVNEMNLENINLKYTSIPDSQHISLIAGQLQMNDGIFSGNKNHVSVGNFVSAKTSVVFRSEKKATPADNPQTIQNPVTVELNRVRLTQTDLLYDAGTAIRKNTFDPNHIHIVNLNLDAYNSIYSESKSQSEIHDFSFSLSEGFMLKKFTGEALFTTNEFKLQNLSVETNSSHIDADIACRYSSLQEFKNSPAKVAIDASIKNMVVDPREIYWFAPDLKEQPFLSKASPPVALKGNVSGTVGDLLLKNLTVTSGGTFVTANGRITGLPEINKTLFAISGFQARTTSSDLYRNLPKGTIPGNMELPAQLSLSGTFKGTVQTFDADVALNSSYGNLDAVVKSGSQEAYEAEITVDDFDAGKLLRNEKQFGSVSLEARVKGKGYSKETADASVDLVISSAGFNGYEYQNLKVKGNFANQRFDGRINMDDPNLVFDFSGTAGFKKGEEEYKFTLNLEAANFQKLNFLKDDIRLAARAELDLKGNTIDSLNGRAGITNIIIVKENKTYTLDSLLFASVNENGNSEISLASSIVSASFKGNIAPGKLAGEIMNHFNRYFAINDSMTGNRVEKNNFTFEIKIQNHPVIAEVFLPKLKEFEPGIIEGRFDGAKNIMELKASVMRLDYDGTLLRDATLIVSSDSSELTGNVKIAELSTSGQQVENIELKANVKNNIAAFSFSAGNEDSEKRFAFSGQISSPAKQVYEAVLGNSVEFGGSKWSIPADNKITFAKNKPLYINVALAKEGEEIAITSKDSTALEVRFKDFKLISVSNMIKKDTALAEGTLNGFFTLLEKGAFNSQLTLKDLKIRTHEIGNLELSAKNLSAEQIMLNAKINGNENDFSASGTISPKADASALDIKIDIGSIDMKTVDAFSFGQLANSKGKITGSLRCGGTFFKPQLNGRITLVNVTTSPAALSTPLLLQNETVEVSNSELKFNAFTIRDENNHSAKLNGTISFEDLSNPILNVGLETDNFLVMNSNKKEDAYFGTVVLDARIKLEGALASLKVNADLKLDDGSNLGIAIPESQLTADRGENVVEFSNAKMNPLMLNGTKKTSRISSFKNLEISADIQVEKNATLKIIVDQSTGDSLVVKGNAALSFTLDQGGKMSLTGRYELDDGSYMVTLQDLIKRQFKIEKGSMISWNGDPMDADIDLRAKYTVRTTPIDLLSNQVSDLESAERNQYKQRLPFEVVLKLKGELLKPDIAFEILLPPEYRGAMGGVVNARLMQLNEDESELNKQVFALLVLNRFVQEDPLASEGGTGAEGIARQSVSRFLTQQLNQWSSQHISGIELDFDVQSYDDYSSGQSQGRTELGVGLRKQFNDRLSVQVGGSLNLEGEGTGQTNYGDLAGDILIEYKLTEDGRYKLKGFRQNEFDEIFEGQIMETGAGIVYTRDFDKWEELFRKKKKTEPDDIPKINQVEK
jgi:translocation and assembly module TamB